MIHFSIADEGHVPEDTCPCLKAPCGLVYYTSIHNFECPIHYSRSKIKVAQFHDENACPGFDTQPSKPGDQFTLDEFKQVVIMAPKINKDVL